MRLVRQLDSVVFGELVAVVFGGRAGTRRFALLPDVIAEVAVPVLVDTVDAARAIASRFPAARIAVVDGAPPWPLLRYYGNRVRPAGTFGQPAS